MDPTTSLLLLKEGAGHGDYSKSDILLALLGQDLSGEMIYGYSLFREGIVILSMNRLNLIQSKKKKDSSFKPDGQMI